MRAVKPWVVREGPALLAACVASLVIAAIGLQLWDAPSLSVPWAYDQDALSLLTGFKGIADHGWIWTNGSLGAPAGQQLYDFGSLGPDNLHWAIAWIVTRFTDQPGAIYNVFLLITFPLTAAAGYLSLRWLDVQRGAACAVAIVYAVIPFHFFRGLNGHLLLADYAVIPLGVFLAVCVILRRPLFEGGWRSATTIRTLVICVLIASSGIYYAAFVVVLLAIAVLATRLERDDRNATLLNGMGALAAIVFVLILNLLPTVLYHRAHGANDLTGQRDADESLKFGLSLIEQVLPAPEHRFAPFRRLADEYWGVRPARQRGRPVGRHALGARPARARRVAVRRAGRRRRRAPPDRPPPARDRAGRADRDAAGRDRRGRRVRVVRAEPVAARVEPDLGRDRLLRAGRGGDRAGGDRPPAAPPRGRLRGGAGRGRRLRRVGPDRQRVAPGLREARARLERRRGVRQEHQQRRSATAAWSTSCPTWSSRRPRRSTAWATTSRSAARCTRPRRCGGPTAR